MSDLMSTTNGHLSLKQKLEVLVTAGIIPDHAPPEQVSLFVNTCQNIGVDPAGGDVHLVGYYSRKKQKHIYHRIIGIGAVRRIATSQGDYGGMDKALYDEGLTKFEWLQQKREKPLTAMRTGYKLVQGQRVPITTEIVVSEYDTGENLWKESIFTMIDKVTESQILRMGWPKKMEGVYTEAEIEKNATTIEYGEVQVVEEMEEKSDKSTQAVLGILEDNKSNDDSF